MEAFLKFEKRPTVPKGSKLKVEPGEFTAFNFLLVGSATKSMTVPFSGGPGIAELSLPLRIYPMMTRLPWAATPEDNAVQHARARCEAKCRRPFSRAHLVSVAYETR